MRSSPLARKTPLRQKTPIGRKSPMRKRNPVRTRENHQRCFDGGIDHDSWIRSLACAICRTLEDPQLTPTQACHTIARGMGAAKGKWYHLWPGCAMHHAEQGKGGNDFILAHYGVDLHKIARECTRIHLLEVGAI